MVSVRNVLNYPAYGLVMKALAVIGFILVVIKRHYILA